MSLEPQTTAKVRLDTTKGPLIIELWAKETPSNSKAFLQNTLNQRFNGLSFDRIIPNFIVQLNGDLPIDEPLQDEPHSRLKYLKRGIVGCVNSDTGRDSNDGRFFITLRETPELQGKNTIIGKVVDDTIFNVLAIAEGKLDNDGETPLYPVKIIGSEVLVPFFNDLVQKEVIMDRKVNEKKKKNKRTKVKLRLGADEDEGDDESVANIKMKSAHDVLNDKKLSKQKVDVKKLIEEEAEEKEEDEEEEVILEKKEHPVEAIAKDREKSLSDIKNRINSLKRELNAKHETEEQPQTSIKMKQSNEDREKETLKLLESFKTNLTNLKSKKELEVMTKDIDFDNLSESDSDTDIYNHQLKFEGNEDNKLANEELLIIDTKNEKTQTKRLNRFYEKESVKRTRK